MKQIYVGNLLSTVTVEDIEELLAPYGTVYSAKIIAETEPGQPHAYAFVEMDEQNADEAIRKLDGTEFFGRTLKMQEAISE
jgi:RNA recognition motif-containing protein